MRVEKRSLTIKENPHMNYTPNTIKNASLEIADLLFIPHKLLNFLNNASSLEKTVSGRYIYCFQGTLVFEEKDLLCPDCGAKMHIHDVYQTTLCYLPIGGRLVMQQIPFKTEGHLISVELQTYAEELLEYGYTNKEVGELTGLGKNTVKQIGLARLQRKYTENGVGEKLQKPEKQARLLSIDEFKLHNGHRYATHIIDLETGHILLIAHGKKKQVVCDFIEHVA